MAAILYLVRAGLQHAEALADRLVRAGHEVRVVPDLAALGEQTADSQAVAALVSAATTDEAAIRRFRSGHGRPVVCLHAGDSLAGRLAAVRLGADHFVPEADAAGLLGLLADLFALQPDVPPCILLIDDDRILNEYHAALLRSAGMTVRTLNEPAAVLEALARFDPDVVFMNIRMAGCSGLELAAAVRLDQRNARLPIVFLSSDEEPRTRLACIRAGGEDFLRKPVEAERLVAVAAARTRLARQLRLHRGRPASRPDGGQP